jgi:hypothetical protein
MQKLQAIQAPQAALVEKGVKVGLAVIGVGVGVYVIRKAIKKRNPDGTTSKEAPSMKELYVNKKSLTISVSDAGLYANTLYGAMQDWGTDESTIFNTINKVQTKDDMLLVIKSFGLKKYNIGGKNSWFGDELNLIGWLRAELDDSYIAKIKPKFDEWGIPL